MQGISAERRMLIMLLFAVGFDQLSKEAARFFGYQTVLNTGISLSFLSSTSAELLTGISLAVLVVLWYSCAAVLKQYPVSAGIFFGAALSNILDRVLYGAVRDWMPIPGTTVVNNLADWLLFISVILFAVALLREGWSERNSQPKGKK